MKKGKKVIKISKKNPVKELLQLIKKDLRIIEQAKLADEILKQLDSPPGTVEAYAELRADQERLRTLDRGSLVGDMADLWYLARKDNGAELEGSR